jgi:hypothetical protein
MLRKNSELVEAAGSGGIEFPELDTSSRSRKSRSMTAS